jgi:hypothetical protein
MALSLGAEGVSHLEGGQWEASVNYRYLASADGYIGDRVWPQYPQVIGAKIWIHSIDLQATYAFTPRFSISLTMPFIHGEVSSLIEHDGVRHTTSAGGLGDMRLVGNAWLLDPAKHKDGNIAFGVGVKAPTGDEKATDTFYKSTGPETRPVDIAIQPGDGGWGINLELVGLCLSGCFSKPPRVVWADASTAFSKDTARVPIEFRHGRSLSEIPCCLPLARRLPLSSVWRAESI